MRTVLAFSILSFVFLQNILADENAVYYIRNVEYAIEGKTKPFALSIAAGIRQGEEIAGGARLGAYIEERKHAILNNRQIESAAVEYTVGEKDAAGKYPVDILVKTADTNNVVVLPYPKFSSSSGTKLELRLRDYNFLGTLSEFKVNLGYARDAEGEHYANAALSFDLPFRFFGLLWRFGFDNEFSRRIDNADKPVYFNNVSSLSVDIPVNRTTLAFGFEENLTLEKEELFDYDGEKSPFAYLAPGERDVIDYHEHFESYLKSTPFAAWTIPLGVQVFSFGELTYKSIAGIAFMYWPFGESDYSEYSGYYNGQFGIFSHSIGFSRINWRGNVQSGFSFNAEQNNEFDFDEGRKNRHDVSVTGIGHIPFADFGGFSFRARYQRVLFTETRYLAIGGPLRGIPDKSLVKPERNRTASGLAFVNLDLPFRIFQFKPSEWGTGRRVSTFDVEFYLSPFIDIAFFNAPASEYENGGNEWLAAGGVELKIFPLAFRSFFLRVSAGFDFRGDDYEVYIGLGNHY
jgi:hypothetical protein